MKKPSSILLFIMRLYSLLLLSFFLFSQTVVAQDTRPYIYYDSSWKETPKEGSFYSREYIVPSSKPSVTVYFTESRKIYSIKTYSDTSFSKLIGTVKTYYASGQLEDSSLYNNEGELTNSVYYYPDGKVWVKYANDRKRNKETVLAYDPSGEKIDDFVYLREADFPGGYEAWQNFIANNMKSNVPIKNGAPRGKYLVRVKFSIDPKGNVIDVFSETDHGFGIDEEVIRVIKKSRKWIPAIHLNKPVKAYRLQPLTFSIE